MNGYDPTVAAIGLALLVAIAALITFGPRHTQRVQSVRADEEGES